MSNDIDKEVKETEIFMLSQFIDVMDLLDSYENMKEIKKDIKNRKEKYLNYIIKISESKDFLSLNLYDDNIDTKIEKCSEIYSTSEEYKTILKKLESNYENLANKLEENDKNRLDEIKGLIYELCDFDVHLSYKIGLVEGMKIKNKCT